MLTTTQPARVHGDDGVTMISKCTPKSTNNLDHKVRTIVVPIGAEIPDIIYSWL